MIKYFLLLICLHFITINFAQKGRPTISSVTDRIGSISKSSGTNTKDSLKKRDHLADSITISYRFIKDPQRFKLDSSIFDNIRFPTQTNTINLGNNGAASKPILFSPIFQAGFDEGKHSLDAYRWTLDKIKYYKTTRPYTEIGYIISSKSEQTIQLTHTQNIKPNWNVALDYRQISAPGYFRNQKNNHSNMVLCSYYQGKKKRYANWFVYLINNFKNSDYGGIQGDSLLHDPTFNDRAFIATNLNNTLNSTRNPFNNILESGQLEKARTVFFKQSYDLGKKDSIAINDSTTQYLFYPKLRIEHNISLVKEAFTYRGLVTDSSFYINNYGRDTLFTLSNTNYDITDNWQKIINDFSIYQFPDTKNTLQYIHAGISYEYLKGNFTEGLFRASSRIFHNLFAHLEYRNKTRNKKWDLNANGVFYLNGYNSGDYEANAILIRNINNKIGNLKLQFQNVNRTPSFIYYKQSSFNINPLSNLKKENNTQLTAEFFNEKKQQFITAQLLIANNFTTFQSFTNFKQEATFNMLKLKFERKFNLYKKFIWRTDNQFQQVLIGNPQINYPVLYTRNQIAYEGNFGFKNLKIATGLDFRYCLPYKLDAWTPLQGQFYYQNNISSKNNLPDIDAYLHFTITSFNAFIRAENLNTIKIRTNGINKGLSFTNNNYAALLYPNPGLVIRIGIYWRFVN